MKGSPLRAPPPLRFLALAIGGWLCLRAAILAPAWWEERSGSRGQWPPPPRAAASASPAPASASASTQARAPQGVPAIGRRDAPALPVAAPVRSFERRLATPERRPVSIPRAAFPDPPGLATANAPSPDRIEALASLPPSATAGRRWSGAAWLLARGERGGASLAPGGTLGGSQMGARILYRLGGGLALTGRAYAPLLRARGAELAGGLDWRPVAQLPVNILLERRQRLGGEGRSAFAVTVYGGASRALPGGLRLDAYFQAGLVGLKSRDAFIDGAARVSAPAGPFEIGAGAWGAAQPGAARLDAGPSLSYALPVAGAHLRLQADWRARIAGHAAPGSGPAITLAADF